MLPRCGSDGEDVQATSLLAEGMKRRLCFKKRRNKHSQLEKNCGAIGALVSLANWISLGRLANVKRPFSTRTWNAATISFSFILLITSLLCCRSCFFSVQVLCLIGITCSFFVWGVWAFSTFCVCCLSHGQGSVKDV